jgi:hypothetical protein
MKDEDEKRELADENDSELDYPTDRGPLFGRREKAVYKPVVELMHRCNPYPEACVEPLEAMSVIRGVSFVPDCLEPERLLPAVNRIEALKRILFWVHPLEIYFRIESAVSTLIRWGYVGRNPVPRGFLRQIDWETIYPGWNPTKLIESSPQFRPSSTAIIGCSGVGKSTSLHRILQLHPQVIVHTNYRGVALDQKQVVWLKIDVPARGSLKALALRFFNAVDQLNLGTKYRDRLRRWSGDELADEVVKVAHEIGLGLLVIDELGRLRDASREDANEAMHFFRGLIDNIPTVFSGTYKALKLFQDFSNSRKIADSGDIIWSPCLFDDEFQGFLEHLWQLQWTKTPSPLTPQLSQAMYDASQGIFDIVVKLYILVQGTVIGNGNEQITKTIIEEVAQQHLKLVRPTLLALKNTDIQYLSKVPDVYPDMPDLDGFLTRRQNDIKVVGALNTWRTENSKATNDTADSLLFQVARNLEEDGITPEVAMSSATSALNLNQTEPDLQKIVKYARQMALDVKGPPSSVCKVSGKNGRQPAPGTMEAIAQGSETADEAYEKLSEAGVFSGNPLLEEKE